MEELHHSSPPDPLESYYEKKAKQVLYVQNYFPSLTEETERRLDILLRVAEILDIDDTCFISYSSAILRLSSQEISLKRTLNKLGCVEHELRDHLAIVRHEGRLITRWIDVLGAEQETSEGLATIEKRKDALVKKAKEYRKELEALMQSMPEEPTVTVTDLVVQQEKNRRKEQDLQVKRNQVKAFRGLPSNLELARHDLQKARNEQMKLFQLRERLLNRMANNVA